MRVTLFAVTTMFVSSLLLVGCYTDDPMPMPRGYSSYDKALKSVDGAKARNVGYEYSKENNEVALEALRFAAMDLVEKLDQKLNFNTDEIYLTAPASTAFYNSFDYLLRDELMQRGYILKSSAKDAVNIELVAKKLDVTCFEGEEFEGEKASSDYNIYLALAINVVDGVTQSLPSDFVGGFYDIPLNDYRQAGNVKIDIPACSNGCCNLE